MSPVSKSSTSSEPRSTYGTAEESYWLRLIPRRLSEMALLVTVVVLISLQLKYLWDVRTAVPHQDEWSLLDEMFHALDQHRVGNWVFHSRNGHFLVPGNLAYLVSLNYSSLDLTALRLLNFPICLAAFLLTAYVINAEIRSRFLRFYLYLGACFVIFNLCFWEHFSQGSLFTTTLSALFACIGLYFIAKAIQHSSKPGKNLTVGSGFLFASILSFGLGYVAVAAAILLLALSYWKKLTVLRPRPGYKTVVYWLVCALVILGIASHPFFGIKSVIIQTVFHSVLVAGSVSASFVDKNGFIAQNIAFVSGVILVAASLSVVFEFLTRQVLRKGLLPAFSLALVSFGLLGCVAIASARSQLPDGEFLSSRYTLPPSICLLGVLLYFACSKVFLLANMWCLAAASYLLATVKELQVAPYRPAVYRAIERGIGDVDNLSDEELGAILYFRENTEGVRRVAARMRRDRLNMFRGNRNLRDAQH